MGSLPVKMPPESGCVIGKVTDSAGLVAGGGGGGKTSAGLERVTLCTGDAGGGISAGMANWRGSAMTAGDATGVCTGTGLRDTSSAIPVARSAAMAKTAIRDLVIRFSWWFDATLR